MTSRWTILLVLPSLASACDQAPKARFLCRMNRQHVSEPLLCRPASAVGVDAGGYDWSETACQEPTEGMKGSKPHTCNRQRVAYCFDPRMGPDDPLDPVCLLNQRACETYRDATMTAHGKAPEAVPCVKAFPESVLWARSKKRWPP